MTKLKVFVAGSLAALIAGTALSPAMAAPGFAGGFAKERGTQFFTNFDANKDGSVTSAEIDAKRKADFAKADSVGDGSVTLEEWKVFAKDRSGERSSDRSVRIFQRFDTDGDGKVTRDEFLTQAERFTTRMDRMKKIMGDRMAMMKDGKGPRSEGMRGDGPRDQGKRGEGMSGNGPWDQDMMGFGKHGGKRGPGGKGMRGEMMQAMIAKVDLNSDGKISSDELNKLADKLFANGPVDLAGFRTLAAEFKEPMYVRSFQRLDTNGDLKISSEEFFAPTAKMMSRMDRNKDGVITSADFTKMKKDWRKGWNEQRGHGGKKGWGCEKGQNGPRG